MNYGDVSDAGHPIGSGAVEIRNRTLVTGRLTRSAQDRGHDGGQGVLTFRALLKSGRFDRAWSTLSRSWKQSIASKPANDDRTSLAHAARFASTTSTPEAPRQCRNHVLKGDGSAAPFF